MKDQIKNKLNLKPFHYEVPEGELSDILHRVQHYPWHEMPDDGGWDYGTNLDYLKKLCTYWVDEFDWRKQEDKINIYDFHCICDIYCRHALIENIIFG